MTLTSGGKDFLATHAGKDNCFQPSGVSYTDADGVAHTGSTGDVANALWVAHAVGKDTVPITADGKNYSDFKAANGGYDINIDVDLLWIYNNDGGAGEPQYCISGTPTPTPSTPTPIPEKYYNVTINSTPSGADITLDGKKTYRLTPETFTLAEGSHTIKLTRAGYEDLERIITVTKDETFSWTLTALPSPTPTPVEIEVVKGALAGSVSIAQSTIPRRVTVGVQYTFRMHVDNPADGVRAKYKVTLQFSGPSTYNFASDWSTPCDPGGYTNCYVYVTMPTDAIPAAQTSAFYTIYSTLEGESV
jgi:hypothetical protein